MGARVQEALPAEAAVAAAAAATALVEAELPQCRPRAHALAAQTPQPWRPATVGAFALATGHVSADQLATSLTRIFTADADMHDRCDPPSCPCMTGDPPPCP